MPEGSGPAGKPARHSGRVAGALLVGVGCCSTALGVLGIFLPLLPTVPLLLLAAACFARSSERCHRWLLDHPLLGPMVQGYLDGKGIPLRAKASAIVLIWLTIPLSIVLVGDIFWLRMLLVLIGAGVTLYLLRLPVCEAGAD